MKTIIAGSRDIKIDIAYEVVGKATRECDWEITEVVTGVSGNVDLAGWWWGHQHDIPTKSFAIPDWVWEVMGKKAGPIRNGKMAEYSDALIAIWDGKSRGTSNMIDLAKKGGLKVLIQYV